MLMSNQIWINIYELYINILKKPDLYIPTIVGEMKKYQNYGYRRTPILYKNSVRFNKKVTSIDDIFT